MFSKVGPKLKLISFSSQIEFNLNSKLSLPKIVVKKGNLIISLLTYFANHEDEQSSII